MTINAFDIRIPSYIKVILEWLITDHLSISQNNLVDSVEYYKDNIKKY